jgi:transposase-like protein
MGARSGQAALLDQRLAEGGLDAEADDRLVGAKRHERSPDRVDTRAGRYERGLHTVAGPVKLRVPKLRKLPFKTEIPDGPLR